MAQTVIQKIIAGHAGRETVEPHEIVWMELDVRSARDFGGANVVGHLRRHYADAPLHDPDKTAFTFDCVVPANTIPYAENQHVCRTFARDIGAKLFDVSAGIGSHVMLEQGLARPGSTVVGTDSHLNLLGCVGCFGQGMGDTDIAFAMATGKSWFEVPETIRVDVVGELKRPATAKDLTLALVGMMGSKGALGCAVELYGPAIDALTFDERVTVCSMGTEMGAIICFITPSTDIVQRYAALGVQSEVVKADPDAEYVRREVLDISDLEPMMALPGAPSEVQPVRKLAGTKVDSVFVGSCTNGRYSDFETMVPTLKRGAVDSGVMAKAVPATRGVFSELLANGLFEVLHNAGFILSNPGCGGCASGQIGMTGKGEVQISTSNRNFRGKQGMGETYLASPLTAAASAVAGKIALPAAW